MQIYKPGSIAHLPVLGIDFPLTKRQIFAYIGEVEDLCCGFRQAVDLAKEFYEGISLNENAVSELNKYWNGAVLSVGEFSECHFLALVYRKLGNKGKQRFIQGHEEAHILDHSGNLTALEDAIKRDVNFDIHLVDYSSEQRADIGGFYALMRLDYTPWFMRRDFIPDPRTEVKKEVKNLIKKYETLRHSRKLAVVGK